MRPIKKVIVSTCLLGLAAVVILVITAPSIQRSIFYPEASNLPPMVNQTTEQLLTQLQAVMEVRAPTVLQALQPGLQHDRIAELESEGKFQLPDELRALYRWRNGMPSNALIGFLPGHRFVPLDEVVKDKALRSQQVDSSSVVARTGFAVFSGHRMNWICVLDDGAGDGYFFDSERSITNGPFFYHIAEIGYYVWFPSVRNFLAGVIECYESGAVTVGADGSLTEDFDKTAQILKRFGKSTE